MTIDSVPRQARGIPWKNRSRPHVRREGRQAGDTINQINDGADQVIKVVCDISSALSEDSSASTEIATQVENVAHMSEENSLAAGHTASAARHLDHLATSMREAVGRFRI